MPDNNIKIFLGIDPGEYGAIAFYTPPQDKCPAGDLYIIDLRIAHGQKKKSKAHPSIAAMVEAIRLYIELNGQPRLAAVETPHSMPSDGHVGAFTFGKACGMIEGILHGLEIPQISLVPAAWKSQMGLSSNKDRSIALAKEKFKDIPMPQGMELFDSPKLHADGRAEAALLAWLIAHKFSKMPI